VPIGDDDDGGMGPPGGGLIAIRDRWSPRPRPGRAQPAVRVQRHEAVVPEYHRSL